MEKVLEKNKCTGCTACASICPKNAITMQKDNEGFMNPVIDQNKCINCGLCKRICPVLNTKTNESINKCYVAYNKNEQEKEKSSSGAIFSLIANYVLDNDGIVIGAAFDNNKLKHIAVTNKKDLDKLKGSKYLQSDLKDIFKYIKDNLKENKILFVGTPCQVAGIKSIIKNNKNLITIDVICHGVPSPKLFENYVKELEIKNNDKLLCYNFRDKSTGWDSYSNTALFKNKKITESAKNNKYMKLFLSDVALRQSCYECNFKLGNKYSDITLGDFWGVQNYYPEMYNKKGVSAIIINTELGEKIFVDIKDNLEYKECSLYEIISGNKSLKFSSSKQKKRKKFFIDLKNNVSIEILVKKYCKKNNKFKKIIRKIKDYIKK